MTEPIAAGVVAEHFQHQLRVAAAVTAIVLLVGLAIPGQLASGHHPPLVALASLTGVAGIAVVLALGRRSWGRLRWPVSVAALGISVVDAVLLTGSRVATGAHQSLGATGWIWVALFIDLAFAPILVFVMAHHGVSLILLLADAAPATRLCSFLLSSTAIIALQTAMAAGAVALRRVAERGHAAAVRRAELENAELVAQHLHADRRRRYDELRATVMPLLHALGRGDAVPSDPGIQRRAAREAARLRRLFAEADEVADPMRSELAAVVTVAERRGVIVQQAFLGDAGAGVPRPVRRALLDAALEVLLHATGTARVTVTTSPGSITVDVVARAPGTPAGERREGPVEISSVVEGERVWSQARWTAP